MNKAVLIAVIVVIVGVVGVGAFLALSRGPPVRTIELEAKEFGFNDFKGGPIVRVKVGETVRIVLKDVGGAPHEFRVVADIKAPGKPNPVIKGAIVEEIQPGKSGSVTFVADKAGKYFYGCFLDVATKPDRHVDRGMFGEFIVGG